MVLQIFHVLCLLNRLRDVLCSYWVFPYLTKVYREYISRESEGSGLPDLKGAIAGVHMHKFFSIRALIGKFLGLIMGMGGAGI